MFAENVQGFFVHASLIHGISIDFSCQIPHKSTDRIICFLQSPLKDCLCVSNTIIQSVYRYMYRINTAVYMKQTTHFHARIIHHMSAQATVLQAPQPKWTWSHRWWTQLVGEQSRRMIRVKHPALVMKRPIHAHQSQRLKVWKGFLMMSLEMNQSRSKTNMMTKARREVPMKKQTTLYHWNDAE